MENKTKSIRVSNELWKKLQDIRINLLKNSLEEVIITLLNISQHIKPASELKEVNSLESQTPESSLKSNKTKRIGK